MASTMTRLAALPSRGRPASPDRLRAPALTGRRFSAGQVASLVPSPLSTPLASVVVLLLLLATLTLRAHQSAIGGVVAWASTNINNLSDHPITAMLASAFVMPGGLGPDLIVVAVTFTVLERAIGAWRTAFVVLAGHVIATLLTEYGLEIGVRAHLFPLSDMDRPDVGVSYAMYAALGASSLLLRGRRRRIAVAAVVGVTLVPLLIDPGLTTAGHLLSVLIGAAAMVVCARPSISHDRVAS